MIRGFSILVSLCLVGFSSVSVRTFAVKHLGEFGKLKIIELYTLERCIYFMCDAGILNLDIIKL